MSSLALGKTGLQAWLLQRISALILAGYVVFLVGYVSFHPNLNFTDWQALFTSLWVKLFSFFALLSLVAHAWIGIWIVLTDYVQVTWLRIMLQLLVNISLISYLIWGILVLTFQ